MEFTYSGCLSLINLAIWIILILFFKNYQRETTGLDRFSNLVLGLCVILFCVCGFSEADTYHYIPIYEDIIKYGEIAHIEPLYCWMAENLPHDYYIWRLAIWGGAFVLYLTLAKRFNIDNKFLGFSFAVILLQQFVVTRASFGISLFLLSSSLLYKNILKNKEISICLGILGIIASFSLHRSMPIFLFIAVGVLIPLNKKNLIISIILFPLIRIGILPYVEDLFMSNFFNDQTNEFANTYLNREASILNIRGLLPQYIIYSARLILISILIKHIAFNDDAPMFIRKLLQFTYILFYIAILFWGQNVSSFVTSRTIHFMCFPLTIVLAYYLSTTPSTTRMFKTSIFLFIFYDLYQFLYHAWKWW